MDLDQIMVKFWAEFDLGLNFVKLRVTSPVRISPFTLLSPKIGILDRKLNLISIITARQLIFAYISCCYLPICAVEAIFSRTDFNSRLMMPRFSLFWN